MAASRFSRRIVALIGLGIALPALLLAVLGVFLTLRVSREVARESVHYNEYIARQVVEAFEEELMGQVRSAVGGAENAAREDAPMPELLDALRSGSEFEGEHFVPVDLLDGYSLLIVDAQPLLYAPGVGPHARQYFVGTLLRDHDGQVVGAGGWWVNPERFVREHTGGVVLERLPGNPRMYGALEQVRRLSVQIFGPGGVEIQRVRMPATLETAAAEPLSGPFEHFLVRVAPTEAAPVVWTRRFVVLEIAFIVLMALAVVVASTFGLRYTIRQLELAQLKSGFVSNVSHELKTPIALIRLAVETLELGRVSTEAEREKFIATIGRETLRLSRLVDNILDFARLEAGQKILRFEAVDAVALVRETLESFRLRLEDQGFAVSTDLPDSLPPARADSTALTHCLLNLFDNAIKYSRQRREVRVSAEARDGFIAISVSDRGIGISAADQHRIFEKFVRVETGLVHNVKGAGLGLSLVDQIMRAHGGRVEVSSVPGEGSTFTLLVPAIDEAHDHEEAEARTGS
jgi:signal transduction histidine kinase